MERDFDVEKKILALLSPEQAWQLTVFDSLPSTNSFIKELGRQGAREHTACLALEQTAGRGRLGRSFHSPKGQGLYLSILLRPKVKAEQLFPATGLAAVLACQGIEAACKLAVDIKWLNDLYAQGKKLCGILAEPCFDREGDLDFLVLGLGLNLYQDSFPPELETIATSIKLQGATCDYEKTVADLLKSLYPLPRLLEKGDLQEYVQYYRSRCISLNRQVELVQNGSCRRAYALDIDAAFGLEVKTPEGRTTVTTGEISVRL